VYPPGFDPWSAEESSFTWFDHQMAEDNWTASGHSSIPNLYST
jgi:hypothetical protein